MKKPIETIPVKGMTALTDYHWPGNVRELENFIERAVILSRGTELQFPLAELKQRSNSSAAVSIGAAGTLEYAEREHIVRAFVKRIGSSAGPQAPPRGSV